MKTKKKWWSIICQGTNLHDLGWEIKQKIVESLPEIVFSWSSNVLQILDHQNTVCGRGSTLIISVHFST